MLFRVSSFVDALVGGRPPPPLRGSSPFQAGQFFVAAPPQNGHHRFWGVRGACSSISSVKICASDFLSLMMR